MTTITKNVKNSPRWTEPPHELRKPVVGSTLFSPVPFARSTGLKLNTPHAGPVNCGRHAHVLSVPQTPLRLLTRKHIFNINL